MAYDLFVRRKDGAPPLEAAALDDALLAAGATPAPPGWTLQAGGARVAVQAARSEGALQGVELSSPFGCPEEDFRALLLAAIGLAARLDSQLMDPRLGAEITPSRAEDAVESWRAANRYALSTAGTVEDVRNMVSVEAEKPFWNRKNKMLLAMVGIVSAAFFLFDLLLNSIEIPLRPID
jgi:hypothetical protein